MDIKTMASLVIGAVLAVILLSTVLVPVVTETTEADNVTYNNSGNLNAVLIANGDSGEIALTGSTIGVVINDVTQTWTSTSAIQPLYGTSAYLNHNSNAETMSLTTVVSGVAAVASVTSISWTAANDKLTIVTNAEDTIEVPLGKTLVVCDSGPYVGIFKQNATTLYYSEQSPYYWAVPYGTPASGISSASNGIISPDTFTLTTNAELVDGTQNVYKVKYSTADFLIDNNGSSVNAGVWLFASKDVVGLGPEKVGGNEKTLLQIIPLLVGIGIVLGVATVYMRRE